MIPIFDLDDTLYPEMSFVESGFRSVALALETQKGIDAGSSFEQMRFILKHRGRGFVFNELLASHGILSKKWIKFCVNTYRYHCPKIQLDSTVEKILMSFAGHSYLVTDGHKLVQANKVKALHLEEKFKKIYITHRYGIKNAKPSIYCFDLIRQIEKCEWANMFYLGDNPAKDFVNLNSVGVHTIRIKKGEHAQVVAKPGYEAQFIIKTIEELPALLKGICK